MKTESCDPPRDVDWSEASSLEVVLSAQENIPGAKAELARREKEAQELEKSADIEKNNPNRDSKGRFTFGPGGPQGGGGAGGGTAVEGAEQAGAAEPYEETDDYRMRHQAPRRADEFGSPATNIGDEMMPGFYDKPQLYGSAYEQSDKESRSVLMSIRDKPNAPVTIYRAVPENVDKINPGDWVTLSPTYAKEHLRSNLSSGGKVLSQVIPAKDLWFDGNSINEFGYDPVD
jgi:hypothetical protein